jgi:hypothetical protein
MITREEAEAIIKAELVEISRKVGFECAISYVVEGDFGWAFCYQGKAYLESGNMEDGCLVGNCPYIIDKRDGSIHIVGTAYPIEHYIEEYRRSR